MDNPPLPPCRQGKRSPHQGGPFEQGLPQCSYHDQQFVSPDSSMGYGILQDCELPMREHYALRKSSGTRAVWKLKKIPCKDKAERRISMKRWILEQQ